jgi:hypothetical protein
LKYFCDNNVSPYLAGALAELCKADESPSQVIHLAGKFPRDAKDTVWIPELAREGAWVVISGDRFNKTDEEREALRRSGLIVFSLSAQWNNHPFWMKAYNLVRWWPAIEEQAARIKGGAAFRVPWKFSGRGRFEQIRFDS